MPNAFTALAFFVLSGLILFASAPVIRKAVLAAPLVSAPVGMWFVAPRLLRAHWFHPAHLGEWGVVIPFLLVGLSVIGLVLALLSAWPLLVADAIARRRALNRDRSMAVAVAALLPLAYVGLSLLIEYGFFRRVPTLRAELPALLSVAAAISATTAVVVGSISLRRRTTGSLLLPSAIVTLIAALSLIVRTPSGAITPAPPLPTLTRAAPIAHPLLVIGLDGANWKVLQPLLDAHRLPTLARLVKDGVRGTMQAQWPPYWSFRAWAAITTGHSKDDLGIHSDMTATAPGVSRFDAPLQVELALTPVLLPEIIPSRLGVIQTTPPPRERLRGTPVWERLSAVGIKNAVVHFPFTYPAVDQSAYIVSDRTVTDLWEMMGVRPAPRDRVVSPRGETGRLLSWFDTDAPIDRSAIDKVLGSEQRSMPADALIDPSATVRSELDTSQRMFGVAETIIRAHGDLEAVFFYSPEFDHVCHALWQYRFPQEFTDDPPAARDVETFGPVLDRYLEYLDGHLAALIASFPTAPNVLIVSDHGEGPTSEVTVWRGWHSSEGVFLAAGPDVTSAEKPVAANYDDVVPTILAMLGVGIPDDLQGHSMLAASPRLP